jgi:hypothetical protein
MGGLRFVFACLLIAGCSDSASTVLVTITGSGTLTSLTAEIDSGDADAGLSRALGAPTLPASVLLIVGDSAPFVHVHLDAVLDDGSARAADGMVQSVAHHQVTLPLALDVPPDMSVPPPDLAQPPDLGGLDLGSSTVLAQDNFKRADQQLWGTASDTQVWTGEANTSNFANMFSITSNLGVVTNTGTSSRMGRLGNKASNLDAQATGASTDFTQTHFGVVIRVEDSNNYYKAAIDGTSLFLEKTQAGTKISLGSVPFAATAGTAYIVRALALGNVLAVKAWAASDKEPGDWMMVLTDGMFGNGQCGVRALAPAPAFVRFSSLICHQY